MCGGELPALPPLPKSPCPFPVNVSRRKQVTEGEIITYTLMFRTAERLS